MKIGLLTYHHSAASYGATLQTYATCMALQHLGHDVEIIDFRLANRKSFLYNVVFSIKDINTRKLWKKVYPSISEYFPDAKSLQEGKHCYDCLMVGSDQTWNPNISQDRCLEFFLNFGPKEIRRVSYASSFGVSSWPDRYQHLVPQIKQLLSRFHAISTREETGREILKNVFGFESTIVIDPTLLIDDYTALSGAIVPNHQLVTFIMNRTENQLARVLEFSQIYGKKPVMTSTIYPYKGFKYQYPPSIGKWLRNIGGADFVIVDSFHALVFCIKYRKQFLVITPDDGLNSRLKGLLNTLGIENRFFYDSDTQIPYQKLMKERIDYRKIEGLLESFKQTSISFIEDSLK
jgi:hypothetical protein